MNHYSDYRDYYLSQMERNFNQNFHQCNYKQEVKPNTLYDPYQGFIRGNLFPDLYDPYKIQNPYEVEPMNEQARLLTYIDSLCFSMGDLNLYLDTHPNDQEMISLFNEYQKEKENATKEYEKKYGPLTLQSNSLEKAPWAWNNLPWPWEYR